MSLVVDRVSARPRSRRAGLRRVRALHLRAHRHQRGGPGGQQAAGLHHVQARDRRDVRSGHHELRRAVQPVDVVSLQPLRRHVGQPNLQVHERVPADARNHHLPVSAGCVLDLLHLRHLGAARARLRSHPDGASGGVRVRVVLHVQAHPASEREGGERSKPALGRTVRLGGQHLGREDLRARGTTNARCSTRRIAKWSRATQAHVGFARPRNSHRVHRRDHHVGGHRVHRGRKRLVRHHARHFGHDVHLHLHRHQPVQLHQQRPAAIQPAPSATRAA